MRPRSHYLRVYVGQLRRKLEPDPGPGTCSPSRGSATGSSRDDSSSPTIAFPLSAVPITLWQDQAERTVVPTGCAVAGFGSALSARTG